MDRVAINPEYYPDFDNARKADMRHETQYFFAELLHQARSALNLLDADFTMLNEPLARLYGLTGPKGIRFERVDLKPGDHRGGLLTQGAFLLGNSTGNDSHAIKRAVWIRKRLLDDPPAPPPPNTPVLDALSPHFARLPIREQMELHRKNPACADCHRNIDPWGIALEGYGADARRRDQILRKEKIGDHLQDVLIGVETDAVMPGGEAVSGVDALKRHLIEHKRRQFARALTSRLLAYALGRSLELGDETAVDELARQFAKNDHNLGKLIEGIVVSEPFRTK